MRVGRNPSRKVRRCAKHAEVTLTTIVYIPFLSGYFADSLDVLKLCLTSMKAHAEEPNEVMVFDNGSCDEVREYLQTEFRCGTIDYLLLSRENLGKAGAWNILFQSAPGDVVAFCDSDMFFKSGWLTEHLAILRSFPNVGMVTGLPIRQQVGVFTQSGFEKIKADPRVTIESGDFISEEAMASYCEGVGRDLIQYKTEIRDVQDTRLGIGEVRAYLGACHFQFVAFKSVLQTMLPLRAELLLDGSTQATGSESELDRKMEELAVLRLSTLRPYVHHLGNTLTPPWRTWLDKLNTTSRQSEPGRKRGPGYIQRRVAQNRYIRAGFMRFYHYVFRLYNAPVSSADDRR